MTLVVNGITCNQGILTIVILLSLPMIGFVMGYLWHWISEIEKGGKG